MFDYLYNAGLLVSVDHTANGTEPNQRPLPAVPGICMIDADDLLDNPSGVLKEYCRHVGLTYDSSMLRWDREDQRRRAEEAFEKWRGWHDDAINSSELRARSHKRMKKTELQFDQEWVQKFGLRGAALIRARVDANMDAYLDLKQFALQVPADSQDYTPYDDKCFE